MGNVITFTSAPPSGSANIYVYYTSPNTKVMAPSAGTVDTTALAAAAVTPVKMANGGAEFGMRNRIINGDMKIDQRNAGALVAGAAGNVYGVDRFPTGAFGGATGRISVQQSNTVPANTEFRKSLVNIVTTSDASPSALYGYCVQHKIEGYNVADLMWGTANAKPVTLSFWVRSSIAGTYIASFSNLDPSDNPNRVYSATYTINAVDTWEQKTITIAGDTTGSWNTTNGNGLFLIWGLGGGTSRQSSAVNVWGTGASVYVVTDAAGCVDWIATSGATFYITGVQLEKGTLATPFEYRPYGTELQLCQRYYYKWLNDTGSARSLSNMQVWTSGNVFGKLIDLPVAMRATPTATSSGLFYPSNSTGGAVADFTTTNVDNTSRTHLGTGSWSGSSGMIVGNCSVVYAKNNAYIDASAEL
jgi:hypothetical protein